MTIFALKISLKPTRKNPKALSHIPWVRLRPRKALDGRALAERLRNELTIIVEETEFLSDQFGTPPHPVGLLRPRRDRPRRRATEPRQKLPPSHLSPLKPHCGQPIAVGTACLALRRRSTDLFLQRERRLVAHSGAALVGGMSAAAESRQPTVEPMSRF
jgi:hypothetical protein